MKCNKLMKEALENLEDIKDELANSLVRDENNNLVKYYFSYDNNIAQRDGMLGRGYYLTRDLEEAKIKGKYVKEAYINADNIYNMASRKTIGNGNNKAYVRGDTMLVTNKAQMKFIRDIDGHKYEGKVNKNMRDFFEEKNPDWLVTPENNTKRLKIHTGDIEAEVEVKYGELRVFSGENVSGKGAGYELYKSIWDYAKERDIPYKPSVDLTFVNQKRMTANMLRYYAENGSNKNILIGQAQWGGYGVRR